MSLIRVLLNVQRMRSRSPSFAPDHEPATVMGAWRYSAGVLVDEHERDRQKDLNYDSEHKRLVEMDVSRESAKNNRRTKTESSLAYLNLKDYQMARPWQDELMVQAMLAHLHLRDSCRVSPEESIAIEEAFEGLDDIFYADNGWRLPADEYKSIVMQGGFPTYGELLPSGVDKLVNLLGLDVSSTFYDLGAGTCRAMLQLACMEPTLQKAVGIELSQTRLEYGALAHERLIEKGLRMCPVEMRAVEGSPISSCDRHCIATRPDTHMRLTFVTVFRGIFWRISMLMQAMCLFLVFALMMPCCAK